MAIPSTFLSFTLVSANLLPDGQTTITPNYQDNHECQGGNQLSCISKAMKVLDLSDDNDHELDSNGEYTSATLDAGALPESFAICSSFMVDAWTTEFNSADMFSLLDREGYPWGYIYLHAASSYTQYLVKLGPVSFAKETKVVFFPLQWTRACLSLDSNAGKVTLVVDGQLLGEEEYRREEDKYRPANLSLLLGFESLDEVEYTGKTSNLNVYSSLSVARMISVTTTGEEECGIAGDFLSWEEAEWTLHSQAKIIEVDREWEGPCRRESKVQVFTAEFELQRDCMAHCQKLSGRSPPVNTGEEWHNFTTDVDLITQDRSILPFLWLSATVGDQTEKLDHWPNTEVVQNETKN